jgi:hypothetical protein
VKCDAACRGSDLGAAALLVLVSVGFSKVDLNRATVKQNTSHVSRHTSHTSKVAALSALAADVLPSIAPTSAAPATA